MFASQGQTPDYENKKGRVVPYKEARDVQKLHHIVKRYLGDVKGKCAVVEGNYYYDANKCYIGWHGDTERRKTIGFRFGVTLPLKYNWFLKGKSIGKLFSIDIHEGDMYCMSDKAVGCDWKSRNIPTLRHSAGYDKNTKLRV